MNTICLFKVTVKGFFGSQYKTVYVISDSLDDAYRTYRDFLDKKDYGFEHRGDRELEKIELAAKFYKEAERECKMLFVSDRVSEKLYERSKLCQTK